MCVVIYKYSYFLHRLNPSRRLILLCNVLRPPTLDRPSLSTTSSVDDHFGLPELAIVMDEAGMPPDLLSDAKHPIY